MASAWLRHHSAKPASLAFHAVAGLSPAHRLKCEAASLSSVAERGSTSQAPLHSPLSTIARMRLATSRSGAAFTTLADSALSPSSCHHSGLPPALRRALRGFEEPLSGLHEVRRVEQDSAKGDVRLALVGPHGDGLAVDLGCPAPIPPGEVPHAHSLQLLVRVAYFALGVLSPTQHAHLSQDCRRGLARLLPL
eukprot:scaffold91988_cov63-Phaeocystis_antarctica.AAC.2